MTALAWEFYARPVLEVAHDLIGCTVSHGGTCGTIIETEAYHQTEPACHAFVGMTARTRPLFGRPGLAYVYRSYGIHALLNAVCEPEGVGAAVLIRALEPLEGIGLMQVRRGLDAFRQLCSGPGKLTQALDVTLDHNESDLEHGSVRIASPLPGWEALERVTGPRIGVTKAAELPWRVCAVGFPSVSRPWPPSLRGRAPRSDRR